MTEYLTREVIKARKAEIVDFEVEELGGVLPLRAIGFRDVMEVQKIEDDVERALEFIRLAITDPETREPMFGHDEFLEVANEWPTSVFQKLADKANDLIGVSTEAREAIEGNSEETTKGGSPIS